MIRKALAAIVIAALFGAGNASAQTYPSKPVTVIVPFAAGGPGHRAARAADAGRSGDAPQGRNREVVADHQGGGHQGGVSGAALCPAASAVVLGDGTAMLTFRP